MELVEDIISFMVPGNNNAGMSDLTGAEANHESNTYLEEDAEEESMEIEELREVAVDSGRVVRCKHCRRMRFGHPLPYGEKECRLEPIKKDEDLKKV